jgi:hypothetical protein
VSRPDAETLNGKAIVTLAAQVRVLRGRLDMLTERVDTQAETIAAALDEAAPGGPAAPSWTDLDPDTCKTQLAELDEWVTTVLLVEYRPANGWRDCWQNHHQAIWELSTLAAEWHYTYNRKRPDLARALEFYDRWLPGTTARVAAITRYCTAAECSAVRGRRF